MNSLYAFKCKRSRNSRHTNIWNTIIMLLLKHPVYTYEGWSGRAGARAGCGDGIEVIVSRRRDAEEKRPVKCSNVLKVVLCYIAITRILEVAYSVFVFLCVRSNSCNA
jgi:hypothetical protein